MLLLLVLLTTTTNAQFGCGRCSGCLIGGACAVYQGVAHCYGQGGKVCHGRETAPTAGSDRGGPPSNGQYGSYGGPSGWHPLFGDRSSSSYNPTPTTSNGGCGRCTGCLIGGACSSDGRSACRAQGGTYCRQFSAATKALVKPAAGNSPAHSPAVLFFAAVGVFAVVGVAFKATKKTLL